MHMKGKPKDMMSKINYDDLILEDKVLKMNLKKTKVSKVDGLNKIPLFSTLLMERWYPVKEVWEKLPWNKQSPTCEVSVIYLDDEVRVMKDIYGSTLSKNYSEQQLMSQCV